MAPKPAQQRIRYVRASDGVQLAWADASSGPVLVKAANWLTHLEDEWDSPGWAHWIQFLCRHFRLVRDHERGCGMSDWEADDLSSSGASRTWRPSSAPRASRSRS